MITLTGLDHAAFRSLHNNLFKRLFMEYTPHTKNGEVMLMKKDVSKRRPGRKRLLTSKDCLGLVLAWTRTRGSMFTLQLIFGMTGSAVSINIRFGRRLLIQVLKNCEDSKVQLS